MGLGQGASENEQGNKEKHLSRVLPSRLCSAEGTVLSLTHGPGRPGLEPPATCLLRAASPHSPKPAAEMPFQRQGFKQKNRYQTVQTDQNYCFHIPHRLLPLLNDSKLKRGTYELEDPKVNPKRGKGCS